MSAKFHAIVYKVFSDESPKVGTPIATVKILSNYSYFCERCLMTSATPTCSHMMEVEQAILQTDFDELKE